MCGYIGFFHKGDFSEPNLQSLKTFPFLKRRGPNQEGSLKEKRSFLYHCRLFTLGDSKRGRQPIVEGERKLLYNGDIYNYEIFDGLNFSNDTEALFHHLNQKGLDGVKDFNGAYSFVYDDGKHIHLTRDRIGIRSLFFTILNIDRDPVVVVSTNFLILAELRNTYSQTLTLNDDYIRQYKIFRYGLRGSAFTEIFSVSPGKVVQISWESILKGNIQIKEKVYWSLDQLSDYSEHKNYANSLEELSFLVKDSIHLRAKTLNQPFGTFLSGGLDSGLITALASQEEGFLKSYYLSMPGETNEDNRLGRFLNHYPVAIEKISYSHPSNKERVIESLELPFGDSIIYPIDQLCRTASRDVNVVLSGEGADEVFGGYIHHRVFFYAQLFHSIFPALSRSVIIKLLDNLPLSFWNTFFPYNQSVDQSGIKRFLRFLNKFETPHHAYAELVSLSESSLNEEDLDLLNSYWPNNDLSNLHALMSFDLKFWSPQYTLYKMDRIGFSHGLDIRVPFFDHRLIEWSLRHKKKFLNFRQNKIPLRQAAKKFGLLHGNLYDEKKFPFRVSEKSAECVDISLLEGKRNTSQLHLELWFDCLKKLGIRYDNTKGQ